MKTLYFIGENGETLLTIPSRLVRGVFHAKKIARRLSAGHKGKWIGLCFGLKKEIVTIHVDWESQSRFAADI